jgi:hypothetical protein
VKNLLLAVAGLVALGVVGMALESGEAPSVPAAREWRCR